ncbi:outer membrane lipoprotein-sorting protein [candidate division WOR-3 bacterium]|nr:outer membrane lipoprotein-sorting protein [candidate division WOR-3 bacterium]
MIRWFAAMAVGLAALAPAGIEPTGREVLDLMKAKTVARDRSMEAEMTVRDRNGREQVRVIRSIMKGDEKMMVTFSEPAELAGVTFLSVPGGNMWIYLPANGRVRRISGSMVSEGFGGSDFSYEEMANISFTGRDSVVATEAVELGGRPAWLLTMDDSGELTRLWVDRERHVPLQVEQLGPGGAVTKRVELGDFRVSAGLQLPGRIVMHDLKKGSTTEILVRGFELNTGLPDSRFTEAGMKRGA